MALRSSLDLQTSKGRNLSPPKLAAKTQPRCRYATQVIKGLQGPQALPPLARLKSINTAAV